MRAILTYHSIDSSGSPVSISEATFASHASFLASGRVKVVPLAEIPSAPQSEDAVALTFDDGFRNFATLAMPLLRDHGLPATIFVVSDAVGGTNAWGGREAAGIPTLPLMDWAGLHEAAAAGFEIGAHTRTHPRLTTLSPSQLDEEVSGSAERIRSELGTRPLRFAYPYGDVNARVALVARDTFVQCVTTELRPLADVEDPAFLPRLDAWYFRQPTMLEDWGVIGLPGPVVDSRAGSSRARVDDGGRARPMSAGPILSVIVPAHNAAGVLPRSLGALRNSDLPRDRWELIVVDDGSDDETSLIAARYADTVVTLPGRPHGPAYARNRGFEVSRGGIIAFIDADCVAHHDTLSRFVERFGNQPEVGAVFGSYDDHPPATGIMSQYRNLIHHHVHHRNAGPVETFWAGAGAVRREVFSEAGMYDEWHYGRPQIEDIELGGRIRRLGKGILLDPAIQVTHLKKWTLASVIRTDLRDRGIPWARLLMHRGAMMSTASLNLRWAEKLNTILVWLATLLLIVAPIVWSVAPIWLALGCIAVVIALNLPLWAFFARVRGPLFAMLVMPAHLMYYLLNGISFGVGLLLQLLIGPPLPDPTTSAYSEVGLQRWPPVPTKNRPSSWTAGDP